MSTPTATPDTHATENGAPAMSTITMYSKPGCVQCRATARGFAKAGVAIDIIDVSTDPTAAAMLTDWGYLSVPVIVTPDGQHWAGHRPDRITAAARALREDNLACAPH